MGWLSGWLAVALALLLVPLARQLAWRLRVLDLPQGHKAHGRAVALLGGPAVLAAVAASLAVLHRSDLGWLAAAVALSAVGLWDDLRGVRASVRLALELGVCWAVLWLTGTRLWAPAFVPGWLATSLTALWLVGVLNATNCLDCADGSLAGVGALAAAGVAGLASMAGSDAWVPALALAGALAGFWVYNRPPASVFLGDAGSLPVGLLLGWLAVRAATGQPASYSVAAILLASVPVLDFLAVHARRARQLGWRGLMDSVGHEHLPHRLARWAGARRALWALYGLQAGSGVAALVAASSGVPWPAVGAVFVWVAFLLWVDARLPVPPAEITSPPPAPSVRVRPEQVG